MWCGVVYYGGVLGVVLCVLMVGYVGFWGVWVFGGCWGGVCGVFWGVFLDVGKGFGFIRLFGVFGFWSLVIWVCFWVFVGWGVLGCLLDLGGNRVIYI